MTNEREVPVQVGRFASVLSACPRSVPWAFIAPHEAQVIRNHGQTLERIVERGGLSPHEIMCAVEGRKLWPIEPDVKAALRLIDAVAAWRGR